MSHAQKAPPRRRVPGWIWIVALLLLVSAVAASAWYVRPLMPDAVDAENCPTTGAVALTAFVVDLTDPIVDIAKSDLRRQLIQYLNDSVRDGEGVQIWRVTGTQGPGKAETAVICKPAAPKSALTSNLRLAKVRYQERYLHPLEAALDAALAAPQERSSAILETLQQVLTSFAAIPHGGARSTHVVLASDLGQHTSFSLEFGDRDYARFRRTPAALALTPGALDDVGIVVLRIARRRQYGHASELDAFWRSLIESHHGTFTVRPVMGLS
jgi:hypothetical protein